MNADQMLRQQLTNLMEVRQAHMSFEDALENFPLEHINTRPPNVEYTFWHLVEHLRICQWDILDYIRNPQYEHMDWPAGYWPALDAETDQVGWEKSIREFIADRDELVKIINDPANDMHAQIPHGSPGHTILREILVVAAHNAYHIGELGILRESMQLWNK